MKDPEYAREYKERRRHRKLEDPDYKAKKAAYNRQRKYGISPEVYEEMVLQQGGRCLICSRKERLEVDHCHDSGKVRGLLCRGCNVGLGTFRDNPVLLNKAIRYLMERG